MDIKVNGQDSSKLDEHGGFDPHLVNYGKGISFGL